MSIFHFHPIHIISVMQKEHNRCNKLYRIIFILEMFNLRNKKMNSNVPAIKGIAPKYKVNCKNSIIDMLYSIFYIWFIYNRFEFFLVFFYHTIGTWVYNVRSFFAYFRILF